MKDCFQTFPQAIKAYAMSRQYFNPPLMFLVFHVCVFILCSLNFFIHTIAEKPFLLWLVLPISFDNLPL